MAKRLPDQRFILWLVLTAVVCITALSFYCFRAVIEPDQPDVPYQLFWLYKVVAQYKQDGDIQKVIAAWERISKTYPETNIIKTKEAIRDYERK